MLVMVPHVTQATNDKEQVAPMVEKLQALPEEVNRPEVLLADAGYFSEKNVEACHGAGITPLIAVGRDEHHPHWRDRFEEPDPLSEPASPVEQMKHRLETQAGRAAYGLPDCVKTRPWGNTVERPGRRREENRVDVVRTSCEPVSHGQPAPTPSWRTNGREQRP